MGNLENCEVCDRPVLELEGQFEILQPYYADSSDPAFELAGWVHTPCLVGSPLSAPWVDWRIKHFSGARGYQIASKAEGWTILHDRRRRALFAFHANGASISADRSEAKMTACAGGGCLSVERDSHLTINDREFITTVQQELVIKKSVPLAKIVDKLGIRDRLQWPEVLSSGEYRLTRQLRRDWSPTSFSARLHHKVFLPDIVLAAWRTL